MNEADSLVVDLYEALEGAQPEKCTCDPDQLETTCACGYELATGALDKARSYYRRLIKWKGPPV